jgi:hypothetical protein
MKGKQQKPRYAFVSLKETYYILLSSITIVLYVKEIFENWIRVVNKNQDTKLSKTSNQTSKNYRRLNHDEE